VFGVVRATNKGRPRSPLVKAWGKTIKKKNREVKTGKEKKKTKCTEGNRGRLGACYRGRGTKCVGVIRADSAEEVPVKKKLTIQKEGREK